MTQGSKAPSYVRVSQCCHCATVLFSGHLIACLHRCKHKPEVLTILAHEYYLISMTPVLFTEGLIFVSNHVIDIHNNTIYKHTQHCIQTHTCTNTGNWVSVNHPLHTSLGDQHCSSYLCPPSPQLPHISHSRGDLGSGAHLLPMTLKTGFP